MPTTSIPSFHPLSPRADQQGSEVKIPVILLAGLSLCGVFGVLAGYIIFAVVHRRLQRARTVRIFIAPSERGPNRCTEEGEAWTEVGATSYGSGSSSGMDNDAGPWVIEVSRYDRDKHRTGEEAHRGEERGESSKARAGKKKSKGKGREKGKESAVGVEVSLDAGAGEAS